MTHFKNLNTSVLIGSVSIALSAIMWGLDGIVLTPQLHQLPVGFVVFILHALPFLLMQLFFYKRYRHLKLLRQQEVAALLMVSLFGGAIGTLSIVHALFLVQFKSLSIVVLLQKLQAVFAIALAALFLKERLSRGYLLWASIALVAGYFLSFGWQLPSLSAHDNNTQAALFALLAAFSFGSSTVFGKQLLSRIDFVSATFFRYGTTSLLMLVGLLLWGGMGSISQCSPFQWQIIGIIALTTGSGAIFLYYYGLQKVRAIIASLMELFFPISAVLFDYFINGQRLSPVQWLSAIVMIAAILKLSVGNSIKAGKTKAP